MSHREAGWASRVGEDTLPFLGRAAELAVIDASVEAIVGGRGTLTIFSGTAGIGKTRLLHESARRAAARGCRVLHGGAWDGEGAPAFWPWIEVLRSYLPSPAPLWRANTDFRELLGEAQDRREPGASASSSDVEHNAQQARFALFDRFCDFLTSLSRDAPLLVTLDDMHWGDPATLLLLQFVANHLSTLPVWICVGSRVPLPEAVSVSLRHPWARHLPLRGLDRTDVKRLIVASGCDPGPELLDQMMDLSEGNPYFAAELGKLISLSPGLTIATAGRLSLPPTLVALMHQQLAGLSSECRRLLHVAAVVGREFEVTVVAAAMNISARNALDLVEEAVGMHVLVLVSSTHARFGHPLTREAIYAALPVSARTQLHHSVGASIQTAEAPDQDNAVVALAHHSFMSLPAGAHREAATHAFRAAMHCYERCAYEESIRILRHALTHLSGHFSNTEHCEILLLLGASESGAGNWSRSRETYDRAARLARAIHAPRILARAALGFRGLIASRLPVDMDAVRLLQEAEEAVPADDTALHVELQSAISRALYFSDDQSRAIEYSRTALSSATCIADHRLIATALEASILSAWRPDHVDDVLELAHRLLATAAALNDPAIEFQARLYRHWAGATLGRLHEADAELRLAERLLPDIRTTPQRWQILLIRSARAITRGQMALSESLSAEAAALGLKVHDTTTNHYSIIQSFRRALLTDSLGNWPPLATAMIDRFPTMVEFRAAAALLHAHLGAGHQAAPLVAFFARHDFENIPDNCSSLFALTCLAEAVHILEEPSAAAALYNRLLPLADHHVVTAWGTLIDGSVHHFLGLLASTCRNDHQATRHFSAALDAHLPSDTPVLTAQTQLAFAIFLISRRTDLEHARRLASDAHDTFRDCTLTYLSGRAAAALAEIDSLTPSRGGETVTPSPPVTNALFKSGRFWSLCFRDRWTLLPDSVGFSYLAQLVGRPGESIHVLDLVRCVDHHYERPHDANAPDPRACAEYRQRLKALRAMLDEAESLNDLGPRNAIHSEIAFLERELSRALDIHGKPRSLTQESEKARVRVRNRLSAALRAIDSSHPDAAIHLRNSVRTGTLCRYVPETPTTWSTSPSTTESDDG